MNGDIKMGEWEEYFEGMLGEWITEWSGEKRKTEEGGRRGAK